jgi:steroid delta-isomerase-like uncharacterized protein
MRKLMVFVLIITAFPSFSQEVNSIEKVKNSFLEGWNKRNHNAIDKIYADSILFHGKRDFIITRDGLPNHIDRWHEAFADFKYKIHHIIVQNDLVAVNASFTGTHIKKFKGIEGSNNKIDVHNMFFFRFDQGLIVEMWEVHDEITFINQMKGEN